MDQPAFVEVRKLKIGNKLLEIEVTREFIELVRGRFSLTPDVSPSDEQVKIFLSESIERTLNRAEG